jgi:mono/diheme cytochrome c family protein
VKSTGLIFFLLLFLSAWQEQMYGGAREDKQSTPAIIVLPPSKTLSAAELSGKNIFVQRCSVCHLPGMASYSTYGPLLDAQVIASRGEAAVRDQIMRGSARMPGFQYTLKQSEVDEIVQFLKHVDFAKR